MVRFVIDLAKAEQLGLFGNKQPSKGPMFPRPSAPAAGGGGTKWVQVPGFARKDGTQVKAHLRHVTQAKPGDAHYKPATGDTHESLHFHATFAAEAAKRDGDVGAEQQLRGIAQQAARGGLDRKWAKETLSTLKRSHHVVGKLEEKEAAVGPEPKAPKAKKPKAPGDGKAAERRAAAQRVTAQDAERENRVRNLQSDAAGLVRDGAMTDNEANAMVNSKADEWSGDTASAPAATESGANKNAPITYLTPGGPGRVIRNGVGVDIPQTVQVIHQGATVAQHADAEDAARWMRAHFKLPADHPVDQYNPATGKFFTVSGSKPTGPAPKTTHERMVGYTRSQHEAGVAFHNDAAHSSDWQTPQGWKLRNYHQEMARAHSAGARKDYEAMGSASRLADMHKRDAGSVPDFEPKKDPAKDNPAPPPPVGDGRPPKKHPDAYTVGTSGPEFDKRVAEARQHWNDMSDAEEDDMGAAMRGRGRPASRKRLQEAMDRFNAHPYHVQQAAIRYDD